MSEWVNELRDAIIVQAAKDYRKAIRFREYRQARALERWFRSEWAESLSRGYSRAIIQRLRKECPYEL